MKRTDNNFRVPILLSQLEKNPQVVHDLLTQFRLIVKEYNYDKDSCYVPQKFFDIEVRR